MTYLLPAFRILERTNMRMISTSLIAAAILIMSLQGLVSAEPDRAGSKETAHQCNALAQSFGKQVSLSELERLLNTRKNTDKDNLRASDSGPMVMVTVSSVKELETAVQYSFAGVSILINDGVYNLNGRWFSLNVPGITIRSASGNRDKVILDGDYKSPSVFEITASDVTIADLTIKYPYNHAIHVISPLQGNDTSDTLIHNVHIVDPGQQAIKINPVGDDTYPVNGSIECSQIELTDAGRGHIRNNCYTGGIDAHKANGWIVRDNEIKGFWCPNGLSEHAIHFWDYSQDTVVERNILTDNARGIGFGMMAQQTREETAPCLPDSDHIRGVIRDNHIATIDKRLFSSNAGADCGICLWYACNAIVNDNRIFSENPGRTFSSIEWRFPATRVEVTSNLTNIRMLERDGATARQSGNMTEATHKWFVKPELGDLNLTPYAVSKMKKNAADPN